MQMSFTQLQEWMAYDELDPCGYTRLDLGFAQVCSTLANINRGKGKPPIRASKFMPKFGLSRIRGKRSPVNDAGSWAQIKAMAKTYATGTD